MADDRRQKSDSGFTLVETVITLIVLSIAAVGVLSVFTVGIKSSANPLVLDQAVQLAQEKMDIIIADRENTARGFAWIIPGKYPAENPVTGFAAFSRNVAIFCVNPGTLNTNNGAAPPCASGYAHVTVTVNHALTGNVAIETLLADY